MTEYILLALGAAVVIYTIVVYNRLVEYKIRSENGFAQIDVQLKRRYDLIPNLVETAKGYMQHERQTLEAVTEARNSAADLLKKFAGNLSDGATAGALAAAESTLSGALGNLQVAVEAYPDLKASANMLQLSEELTSTENKISFARQAYNDAVNTYNAYRQSFPPILLARLVGHRDDIAFLQFAEGEKLQQAPTVSF